MSDSLRAAFPVFQNLPDERWESVASSFQLQTLDSGEPLIREGDTRRRAALIVSGIVRYYVLTDAREHVTGFDMEGSLAGDLQSFFNGGPAAHTVEAIGSCELAVITFEAFIDLAREMPELASVRPAMAESLWVGMRTRAVETQTLSAEERYIRLTERSPHLIQRVPLYMIASYLGISPEALSRIRRRL